jgi:hypothetical protein
MKLEMVEKDRRACPLTAWLQYYLKRSNLRLSRWDTFCRVNYFKFPAGFTGCCRLRFNSVNLVNSVKKKLSAKLVQVRSLAAFDVRR